MRNLDKLKSAYAMRQSGKTYVEIGKTLNICTNYARSLCQEWERINSNKWVEILGPRLAHYFQDCDTVDQIKARIKGNKIVDPSTGEKVYNVGKKSVKLIVSILDIDSGTLSAIKLLESKGYTVTRP